ncbi:hypothetical protein FO519_005917 [Halicephalobus sp. NKZ332]|nr:hypothetical protein FO519_005917 [Halicephalobus sp. NKZ332]
MSNASSTSIPNPEPVNPNQSALKAVLIIMLFVLTWLSSMLAFVLKKYAIQRNSPSSTTIFSLVSCFGGGVFLGTCLLDLLPDSLECIEKAFKYLDQEVSFPWAPFCVSCGFLMVLFIEQSIVYARERNWIGDSEVDRLLGEHDDHHLPESPARANPPEVEEHDVHFDPDAHSSMRAFLLVSALSLHAVFEGLSLGLISQATVLLQIFGALVIHKCVIGFSLGVRLVQSKLKSFTVMVCCLIFAAQVLIGGFFGLGIIQFMNNYSKGTTHLVSGVLQSIALFLITVAVVCRQYLGWLLSKLLARKFGFKSVKLTGIRIFGIENVKVVVRDGLSVEIQDLRLSSSFVNQEHRKPIMFTAADVRIESELSLIQNSKSKEESQNSQLQLNSEKQAKLMQWLQYIGAKVKTSNVVLLDAIPDCLMHVAFDGLQLETYLDREGLQVELLCKLIQSKLFLRKTADALLLDVSVAGSVSVDVADGGKLKRLGIALRNPIITLFDGIVDYFNSHPIKKSSKSSMLIQTTRKKEFPLIRLLKMTPNINCDIDNLTMNFVATMNMEFSRTLSLSLQKIKVHADTALQTASLQFVDCVVSDHRAVSCFRGQSFSATIEPKIISTTPGNLSPPSVFQVTVHFFTPFIVLYQHDLSWWLDYIRGPQFEKIFKSNNFADDFSRDFSVEEVKILQNNEAMKEQIQENFARVYIEAELMDFQCQLKNLDGSAVVFGIDLATFSSDQIFNDVEFGVESFWCHHATTKTTNERLSIDFEKHIWGTTVAIGAGLAKFTQHNNSKQVCIQLDECQFEWEEEVVQLIFDFAQSLRRKDDEGDSLDSPFEPPELSRDDSWSSIDTMSSKSGRNNFVIQLYAKKLDLFFTAKKTAFLAFSIDNWKFESNTGSNIFSMIIENIKIAQGEQNPENPFIPCNWFNMNPNLNKNLKILKCGGCEKVAIRFISNTQCREFVTHFESSLELIWSPLAYIVFFEVFRKVKEISKTLSSTMSKKRRSQSSKLLLTIVSDHPVEFGFRLPRDHLMRWVVPSIQFLKVDTVINLMAPTFLFEMDGHLIMSLESPRFQRMTADSRMDMGRQEFRKLQNRTNKLWWWHADNLQVVFPYKYDFAAGFDEVVNSVKWMKQVHGIKQKEFTSESPLPSDLKITIKSASLQMNDDPFEVQLQTIYEVMMDEVFERERRRRMLEEKISILMKEDPLFPKSKIEALYQKLITKDGQIYVDRIRKVQQPVSKQRQLLLWTLKEFELHAFADQSFHGKRRVLDFMQQVNPESPLNGNSMDFSTMWARAIELDIAESRMQFRDYPMPWSDIKEAYFWGTVAAAEYLAGDRSIRDEFIYLPEPWGTYQVKRNMCPLKFYYDLECEITDFNTTYGPCWEPCLSMVSLCWNYVNSPSRDPSPPLPFWDKIRLLVHGRFSMLCKRLVTSMLASADPYNDTEIFTIDWSNFGFDWITGQFRIQSEVNAFVRTASKYDDSRLLYLPAFRWGINLDWACPGSSHDHHSVTPMAPNKLPEYSTNVEHDSYRSFRSSHLDVSMNFEVKGAPDDNFSASSFPQLLVYANTVKWFDFLKNTLMIANRPVKRGPLFGNPHLKKQQLSKHLKHLHVNANLPKFMATYWMSYSPNSHGLRMFCKSLQVMWAVDLQTIPSESTDGIQRKPITAWKTSVLSIQLENAQIRLYGADRQPEPGDLNLNEDDKAFFVGLSRLSYDRETNESRDLTNWNVSVQQLLDEATNLPAVHRITVHDLRASWTVTNRDTCLAIMEGFQKAYLLQKVLSNDAMKILEFDENNDIQKNKPNSSRTTGHMRNVSDFMDKSPTKSRNLGDGEKTHGNLHSTLSSTFDDGGAKSLLWKLVDEAETNLVAYSEDSVEPPKDSLHGVSLCSKNDVLQNNWQIDLLNSQVVLNGYEKDGFIVMTAARASVTQKVHLPVWRNAQLLLKKSWTAMLSGMQYFAPLVIGKSSSINRNQFRWLSRDVIEEKVSDANVNDKIDNFSATGEAVGGVVADPSSPGKREMEERSELNRKQALQHDDEQILIARRFEVCFEDAIWALTENDGQLSITEMQIRNFLYTRTARIDNSGDHLLEVRTVKVINLMPDCKYKEVLARLPNSEGNATDNTPAIRVICRDLPPVGGISVKEHFEVNIVPMHVQMTFKFYSKMMAFFFPNRNIGSADQQNLDQDDNQVQIQVQPFSLKKLKGAVNGSFRTKTVPCPGTHSDEIDKMKERAEKNNVFVYIIIPQVAFVVTYRGGKEKNLEDVDRVLLTIPVCEYHDKNWTWLDLALALKQRCRRTLLQQFMAQKLFRSRAPGSERAAGLEPVDEEEKKRIVLGATTPVSKGRKKSKT